MIDDATFHSQNIILCRIQRDQFHCLFHRKCILPTGTSGIRSSHRATASADHASGATDDSAGCAASRSTGDSTTICASGGATDSHTKYDSAMYLCADKSQSGTRTCNINLRLSGFVDGRSFRVASPRQKDDDRKYFGIEFVNDRSSTMMGSDHFEFV